MMRALLPVFLIAFGVSAAVAQIDASGHWEGSIEVPKGPSKITLDLARNEKANWIASLGVPERNATGLIVSDISLKGNKLKFSSPDMPGTPVFDLTFENDKLTGTLTMKGTAMPVVMSRNGEAKVEITPPSPAVSTELEGDWEGELALPDGVTRPLLFHFRNLPDHTVAGTLDTPAQGGKDLGLAGVVQSGNNVEFSVRIHGGHFKGALNQDGTELTGEWLQAPEAPPLACKMKKLKK